MFVLVGRSGFDVSIVHIYIRDAIIFGMIALFFLQKKPRFIVDSALLITLASLGWLLVSSLWLYSGIELEYIAAKPFDVLALIAFLFLFRQFVQKDGYLEGFAFCLIALSFILFLLGLGGALSSRGSIVIQDARATVLGSGPITYGRMVLVGVLLIGSFLVDTRKLLYWLGGLGILAGMVFVIFMTGSRGVFAGLIVGVLFVLYTKMFYGSIWYKILIVVMFGFVFYWFFGDIPDTGILMIDTRILPILRGEQVYLAGRDIAYELFLRYWDQHIYFGWGLGGFAEFYENNYPHNIFLELVFESGLVGLVLFGMFFVKVTWSCLTSAAKQQHFGTLFLGFLTTTLFSGDIYDSRAIFVVGLIILISTRKNGFSKGGE